MGSETGGTGMSNWPTGTVTFLMTDVVGSSALAESEPDRYLRLLRDHDELARSLIADRGGFLVKHRGEGDSIFAAFAQVDPAATVAAEFVLRAYTELGLELRAAIHCGPATFDEGDYRGDAVNRCGRIRSLALPRQVVISGSVCSLLSHHPTLPLGPTVLRGLARPIELHLLDAPGLHLTSPLGSERRCGNVVAPETVTLGRERDLETLTTAFERSPIVELTGTGGVGKTRLAIECALQAEALGAASWFVDLTRADRPPIEGSVLAELGLTAPGDRDPVAVVAEHLQPGDLLVLDNCEHLAAPVTAFVRQLRTLRPNARVLLTTLRHLAIPGAIVVPLSPLATAGVDAPAVKLLRSLAEAKAIPIHGSDDEIAGLCADLDGLPLAFELIVPRLRTLTVAKARTRLSRWLTRDDDQQGDAGGNDHGDTPLEGRHASLRALVTYSLGRLSGRERRLLQSLSPFVGGFDLDLAERVSDGDPDEIEVDLAALVDASMIFADEHGRGPRFRMLTSIRNGAENSCRRSGHEEGRSRRFLLWATETSTLSLDVGAPYEAVRLETANLEAAFSVALELGDYVAAAAIARALRKIHLSDANVRPGRTLYERLIVHREHLTPEDRADALNALGIFRMQGAEFALAREALIEANRSFEALGLEERTLATLHNLSICTHDEQRWDEAIAYGSRALEGYLANGDETHAAATRLTLANSYLFSERLETAELVAAPLAELAAEGDPELFHAFRVAKAIFFAGRGDDDEATRALAGLDDSASDQDLAFALLVAACLIPSAELSARCQDAHAAYLELNGRRFSLADQALERRLDRSPRPTQEAPRTLWPEVEVEIGRLADLLD